MQTVPFQWRNSLHSVFQPAGLQSVDCVTYVSAVESGTEFSQLVKLLFVQLA